MLVPFLIQAIGALSLGGGPESILLDGRFEDWPSIADRNELHVDSASDRDFIFIRLFHPGPPRVVQHLDEPLEIAFDLDDDERSGCNESEFTGCELRLVMSPSEGRRTRGGVAAYQWDPQGSWIKRSPYDYGFVMAPTTASRQHEIRLEKSKLPGQSRTMAVHVQSGANQPIRTEVKERSLTSRRPERDKIPSAEPGHLRILSWNIEHGGFLKRADTVKSVLRAIDPDVLLIQELEDNQDATAIKRLLDTMNSGENWTVSMSPKGSGLRCAVASRIQSTSVKTFDRVTRSDSPNRTIRVAGLVIENPGDDPILAISLHLKCCGALNGKEDLTRISEALSIREAISEAVSVTKPSGLVIGGDFNLVASPVPLDILRIDGNAMLGGSHEGDLAVTTPVHLDGRDTYTWYNEGSAFTPGILDYILIGGDLVQTDAFVLDTTDLGRSTKDVDRNATGEASDHLPVVVDIAPADQ
ncbi:MAG: hypothetical protein CMJ29_10825 [Phycisphaerae bacterium]|nr:hypothetical protein [Phycisphaerae bacterium]MAT82120.1 hypothetical protein [Phycisphaerae bacterium]|tara:strand:- start:333 stop:1742 length:1410 start_codon:yes stop_codon:yes gene_type:complete